MSPPPVNLPHISHSVLCLCGHLYVVLDGATGNAARRRLRKVADKLGITVLERRRSPFYFCECERLLDFTGEPSGDRTETATSEDVNFWREMAQPHKWEISED